MQVGVTDLDPPHEIEAKVVSQLNTEQVAGGTGVVLRVQPVPEAIQQVDRSTVVGESKHDPSDVLPPQLPGSIPENLGLQTPSPA